MLFRFCFILELSERLLLGGNWGGIRSNQPQTFFFVLVLSHEQIHHPFYKTLLFYQCRLYTIFTRNLL